MFEFRRQPLKTLYLVYLGLSTVFVRLPFWTVRYSIPTFRPRKTWSFSRSLFFSGMKMFVNSFFAIGIPASPGDDPEAVAGTDEEASTGFTWVDPVDSVCIVGEIKEMAGMNDVHAVRTSGYWYGTKGKSNQDEKVVYHIHSGGHVYNSAHPKAGSAGDIIKGLIEHSASVNCVFAINYRLASSAPFPARNPFPAGLIDCLSGYCYLLKSGFRAENIVVSGDSSGGNLAIALVRYLASAPIPSDHSLPLPAGVLLASPSVEWGLTHTQANSSMHLNVCSDFSERFLTGGYTTRSLLGALPAESAFTSPWISPASLKLQPQTVAGMFDNFPPTYLLVGEAEMMRDATRTVSDRLVACIGKDKVVYHEVQDASHDILTMVFWEPERSAALEKIGAWIEGLWMKV